MTIEEQRTMMAIQSINQKVPDLELRDIFAMNALSGIVVGDWGIMGVDEMAELAYKLADAMIKERSKK